MFLLLSPAVLAHEAEGEFAAVGGGDGEEVGGWGLAGEVEGVLVGACGGEHHLFAAALHVGEPRGDNAVVRLQCAATHIHVVALVVGKVILHFSMIFVGQKLHFSMFFGSAKLHFFSDIVVFWGFEGIN